MCGNVCVIVIISAICSVLDISWRRGKKKNSSAFVFVETCNFPKKGTPSQVGDRDLTKAIDSGT